MNLNRRIARLEDAAAARAAEELPDPTEDTMALISSDVQAFDLFLRLAHHHMGFEIDYDREPIGQVSAHLTEAEEAEVTQALVDRLAVLRAAQESSEPEPSVGAAGRSRERRRHTGSGR
jgi:hypothetical protein